MDKIFFSILIVLALGFLIIYLTGCSTVGKGQSSLIRAKTDDFDLLHLFPQYVTSNKEERLVALTKNASTDYGEYINFLRNRYGSSAVDLSILAITIRDRGKLPPFLPVDVQLPSKLYDLYTSAGKTSAQERMKLERLLKARLYNVPDLIPRTTVHHFEGANEIFYYYPRLSLDFSSQLPAQNVADRFSYLAVALILKEQPSNERGDALRFADFWPKDADIVEYTRGSLTQEAQLSAKGTAGASSEVVSGTEKTQADSKSTLSDTAKASTGAELSYMFNETYVNELKDAFERRKTGIFENGRTFLAEFRSIKNKRIGGTYNFDLMLEVPSKLDQNKQTSEPIMETIVAKAYMIAVIRHVHTSGMTGIYNRVPEPDNDEVYEQVVVEEVDPLVIWRYNDKSYDSSALEKNIEFKLKVITNINDARFVVRDIDNNKVIGAGKGTEATITLPVEESRDIHARVEFLDMIIPSVGEGHITLKSQAEVDFTIPRNQDGFLQIVGEYNLAE